MKTNSETLSWLTSVPASDQNFKEALKKSDLATCEEALKHVTGKGTRAAIEARIKKLFRAKMEAGGAKLISPRPAAPSGPAQRGQKRSATPSDAPAPGKVSKAIVIRQGRPIATLAEFENLGPISPADPGAKFALVNEYHELARASMAQSCAYMILAGVELLALKADAEHGTWQELFADRGDGKSKSGFTFGFTYQTARNYERLADAAKKRVPELRALCASNTPLALMPPEDREKLVTAVRKTGDGHTYGDLAKEWGLVKKPPGNGGGSQPAGDAPKLTAREAAEQAAQNLFHRIALSLFQGASEGEKQKLYHLPITSDAPGDVTGLADLADHTRAFLRLVETVLEEKKQAARKTR